MATHKQKVDSVRDLIDEVDPTSILPDTRLYPLTVGAGTKIIAPRDPLSALFSARERVIFEGDRVPAWWTPKRDEWLWWTMIGSDVLSSATFSTSARLSSVPINVVPIDKTNRAHRRLALWSDMLLKYHWVQIAFQAAVEWQTQDNGAFIEVIGAGDPGGPIEPTRIPGTQDYIFATGLRMLDSQHCRRTGDPTYPIIYRHRPIGGVEKIYKFHSTRVIALAQMPSTRSGMNGVGLCGASRAIRSVLRLDDINMLEDEMLGARPISQLIFSRGISAEEMKGAFQRADDRALEEGRVFSSERKRTARSVFVSAEGPSDQVKAASVEMLDLKRLPEGYNAKMYMELCINIMAMALGFDTRELWPGTETGATRADAEVQQKKSMVKTPGIWMNTLASELGRKWCPWPCYITFDEQDDAQDMLRAEIHRIHAETIERYVASGVVDFETVWQMMMENGDISEEQYNQLRVSEEFQIKAEMLRIQAERARAEVEQIKIQGEVARAQAETARIQAENPPGDAASDGVSQQQPEPA